MRKWIISRRWTFLSALLGAIVGYTYWYFYGCVNGCSITGSALNSTIYCMVLGAMLPGLFLSEKNKPKNTEVDKP